MNLPFLPNPKFYNLELNLQPLLWRRSNLWLLQVINSWFLTISFINTFLRVPIFMNINTKPVYHLDLIFHDKGIFYSKWGLYKLQTCTLYKSRVSKVVEHRDKLLTQWSYTSMGKFCENLFYTDYFESRPQNFTNMYQSWQKSS